MKTETALLPCFLLASALVVPAAYSQDFTFTTVAGQSHGFLNGTNTAAEFSNPTGVAVDAVGNLYIADHGNNAIREVVPQGTNWIVTTIAGGTRGSLDGANTAAQFFGPTGIAIDTSGKLYVSDQGNSTIRLLTPSGTNWVVSTIAGSAGMPGNVDATNADARFSGPAGLSVDSSGNIFVADEVNNSIREVAPQGTNWVVTTIAGGSRGDTDGTNSAAQFFTPASAAVDSNGRIFVADVFNNAIRLVTPTGSNWVVTTIAGQPSSGRSDGTGSNAQFDGPVGVMVTSNDTVYVADMVNESIRKMTPVNTNWEVTTIAGGQLGDANGTGTNAQFNLPYAVAADAFGDVFVADSQNNAIRMGVAVGSAATTGSMQVTITPSEAVSGGAGWMLDGGALQTNSAILTGIAPGGHTLQFTSVSGFTTPALQTVSITARQTAQATGNYTVAIANAGSLQVIIAPAGAVSAGAEWQVDDGQPQTNLAIISGLSVGAHTVTFSTVPGWTTPANQTITITNAETTLAQGGYALQTGSLQVTILPPSVRLAGAQWQVDGGTLQASGTTLTGLLPGTHTVGFNTTLGWMTPANQQIIITNDLTTTATGVYVQLVAGTGALQVAILPASAVTAGAQWMIDGGAPLASGSISSNLAPGLHSLTFTTIAGWTMPTSLTVSVTNGETNMVDGIYTQIGTNTLQVNILPAAAVSAGAQWQVDSGPLQASGAAVTGLLSGQHTVDFALIPGWIPPAQRTVTVIDGQPTTLTAVYIGGKFKSKPIVVITNGPRPNAKLTTPQVTFEGRASDNVALSIVLYQLNGAGYQPADGTTNWSADLTLAPGPNLFQVKATDVTGNSSPVVSRVFNFIVPSVLTVTTNGDGRITPSLNGKSLDVGYSYRLTAIPKPGNLFSNWSGSLTSTGPVLNFVMQSNMMLQANFIPNPFIPQEGGFTGLFYDTNAVAPQSSGLFNLTLEPTGAFSISIVMDAGRFSGSGQFGLTGNATAVARHPRLTSLTVDLQLDFSNHLTGTISDGTWTAVLNANRAAVNFANVAMNFAGHYTMAIGGGGDGTASPAGDGYATLSVSPSGIIQMTGGLADGTVINQNVNISDDGQWPFYEALPGGGLVLSWITFSNQPASTLGGSLTWIRPAGPTPKLYTAGFTNLTDVIGSSYRVTNGEPVVALTNQEAVLADSQLGTPLTNSFVVNDKNILTVVPGAEDLTLSLKPGGLVTGSFRFPGAGAVTQVRGVVLQQQDQVQGYFLGISQDGSFEAQ